MHKKLPPETILPACDRWGELYEKNVQLRRQAYTQKFGSLITETASEVFALARSYSLRQVEIAGERGIVLQTRLPESGAGLVLTGHQPIVYHFGIAHKLRKTCEFASKQRLAALNLIVDADAVAAGRFYHPEPVDGGLRLRTADLGSMTKLALNQVVKGGKELQETFAPVIKALERLKKDREAHRTREVYALYAKLEGERLVRANSIVRQALLPELGYLELPLTEVAALECIKRFFIQILKDSRKFALVYNTVLAAHRESHRIENPANPFPNLRQDAERSELPFWLVDLKTDRREPVFVESAGVEPRILAGGLAASLEEIESGGYLLIPKGALSTLTTRLLAGGLFVHGFGGVKYDVFTDTLITKYFGVEAPAFTCASASRYLFEAEIEAYETQQERKFELKDVAAHTENYLGRGHFAQPEERTLKELLSRRKKLLASTEAEEKQTVQKELHEVSAEIKAVLSSSAFGRHAQEPLPDEDTLRAWYCREYPFFWFR